MDHLRTDARAIWDAAVAAVRPGELVAAALVREPLRDWVSQGRRVIVLGAGKAGAAMAAGVETALADRLERVTGLVNVPEDAVRPLRAVRLHAGRPAGVNSPTEAGVAGSDEMLRLAAAAGPEDVGLCLLSGGGSALLPAPVEGVSLADKQAVTALLHGCGAPIGEMNCVRKHLSRIKGGRLAEAFRGRLLVSLIISDVVGDPLDVIASGPTVADPTTFADALAVLRKYDLTEKAPASVRHHLEEGAAGRRPETPKRPPGTVQNLVLGSNAVALAAAEREAERRGYRVVNLGAFIEGETAEVARVAAGVVRSIRADDRPVGPPACLLLGGETTVRLPAGHGQGVRNQEFVLAALDHLGAVGCEGVVLLSGGTDGEDGPTDAAGAVADSQTWERARLLAIAPAEFLGRHDAYHFFSKTGDLLRTGLTGTNVMDVRVLLVR